MVVVAVVHGQLAQALAGELAGAAAAHVRVHSQGLVAVAHFLVTLGVGENAVQARGGGSGRGGAHGVSFVLIRQVTVMPLSLARLQGGRTGESVDLGVACRKVPDRRLLMLRAILAVLWLAGLPMADAASTPPGWRPVPGARYANAHALPADHPEHAAQGL